MTHVCICGTESIYHSDQCHAGGCEAAWHWPPLCCPDCPCHSYQEAHPTLRVLQAIADEQVSFRWHGSQLRLRWWTTLFSYRLLTAGERKLIQAVLKADLAKKDYAIGYLHQARRGVLALTDTGRKQLAEGREGV